MKKLSEQIVRFFHNEPFVIVATLDKNKRFWNSCKGIVDIDKKGLIYLLDLYKRKTYANLKEDHSISLTAVNEHNFAGYSLIGNARIVKRRDIKGKIIKQWHARLNKRITRRVIKNIRGEKGHPKHPEALFPNPEYLIEVEVTGIIDLTPGHIK
jgi:uncharacterized pyridoxamine 5'-phosphate oxidase family protein